MLRKNIGTIRAAAVCLCAALALSVPLAACTVKTATSNKEPARTDEATKTARLTAFWQEGTTSENEKFTALTGQYFHDALDGDAYTLHCMIKDYAAYGFKRPEMNLYHQSAVTADYCRDFLKKLEGIDYSSLSRKNQITYDVLSTDLKAYISYENDMSFVDWGSYFDYSSGYQAEFPLIALDYDFLVKEDVDDYMAMLDQTPAYFDYLYGLESERVEYGYGLSDEVLTDVIGQFTATYGEGESTALISAFDERMDAAAFLTDAEKADYKQRNKNAIINEIFPKYKEIAEKLKSFMGKGRKYTSLSNLDGGKGYYEYLFKSYTGYYESVDSTVTLLENYINSKLTELQSVASSMSYDALNKWADYNIGSPTDADEIMKYYSTHLDGYFPAIGDTTYTIDYLSKAMGATMPNTVAYYVTPRLDDYSNGHIAINSYVSDSSDMLNTITHEGYPGHMYQYVYYYSTAPDPARETLSFLGYTEGWAVYASRIAEYIYQYPDTEYSYSYARLNDISYAYSYAVSAMCDIGVNYLGWSSKELSSKLTDDYGSYADDGSFYKELIEEPGVYLSYGVGNMFMDSVRSTAETLAGSKFDLEEYHKLILEVGPCTFDYLEKTVKEYYA